MSESGRYLSFVLGGENYAVEVERVEVVLETAPITRVPNAPAHLRGVINYRGSVIPVADLRTRFGQGRSASGAGSSIIVLNIVFGGDTLTIGVLADEVREVIDIPAGKIELPPRVGRGTGDSFIAGVGEQDGRFIVILDIDEAFGAEAPASLDEAVQETL